MPIPSRLPDLMWLLSASNFNRVPRSATIAPDSFETKALKMLDFQSVMETAF